MNDIDKMTRKSQQAMQEAAQLAEARQHAAVEPLHLLYSLVHQRGGIVPALLEKENISQAGLSQEIDRSLNSKAQVTGGTKIVPSAELIKVFKGAEKEAIEMEDSYISTEHFLLSLLKVDTSEAQKLLKAVGWTYQKIKPVVDEYRGSQKVTDDDPESKYDVLGKYARDLTELAEEGKLDPIVGRDSEIRRVVQVLARRTKNNPVLIGQPGVGKTAIAEGLALRVIQEDVPDVLLNKKIMSLDVEP